MSFNNNPRLNLSKVHSTQAKSKTRDTVKVYLLHCIVLFQQWSCDQSTTDLIWWLMVLFLQYNLSSQSDRDQIKVMPLSLIAPEVYTLHKAPKAINKAERRADWNEIESRKHVVSLHKEIHLWYILFLDCMHKCLHAHPIRQWFDVKPSYSVPLIPELFVSVLPLSCSGSTFFWECPVYEKVYPELLRDYGVPIIVSVVVRVVDSIVNLWNSVDRKTQLMHMLIFVWTELWTTVLEKLHSGGTLKWQSGGFFLNSLLPMDKDSLI